MLIDKHKTNLSKLRNEDQEWGGATKSESVSRRLRQMPPQ